MVNSNNNKKAPAATIAAAGNTLAAASNSVGTAAGSGGIEAQASTSGVIPGSAPTAKSGPRTEITQIVHGLGTQFPSGTETLLVKGQATPVSGLITTLAAVLGLYASVDGARQSLKSAQLALNAALPGGRSLIAAIKVALVALFGKGNPVLQSFGINVAPRRKLTSEQLTARTAKAAETRAQRGTQGKRQKAAVKFLGTVAVQTSLSGNQAAGGNATPTGTNPSPAGAPTGASPTSGNTTGSGGTSQP